MMDFRSMAGGPPMKKRLLTLAIVAAFCNALCGCCLNHEWQEATYTEPRTCVKCGGTEGEPKPGYFEQHNVDVPDGPINCTADYIYYNEEDPKTYCKVGEAVYTQTDCYAEPVDEEGYQLVHLILTKTLQPGAYYDAGQDVEYCNTISTNAICDWYTGLLLPGRDSFGDDSQENSFTLEIDGVSYQVSYSRKMRGGWGDWVYDEAGNAASEYQVTMEYIFRIPEGYDGLVFGVCPEREYNEEDDAATAAGQEKGNGKDKKCVALDPADEDYTEGQQFFRINHTKLPVKEALE